MRIERSLWVDAVGAKLPIAGSWNGILESVGSGETLTIHLGNQVEVDSEVLDDMACYALGLGLTVLEKSWNLLTVRNDEGPTQ